MENTQENENNNIFLLPIFWDFALYYKFLVEFRDLIRIDWIKAHETKKNVETSWRSSEQQTQKEVGLISAEVEKDEYFNTIIGAPTRTKVKSNPPVFPYEIIEDKYDTFCVGWLAKVKENVGRYLFFIDHDYKGTEFYGLLRAIRNIGTHIVLVKPKFCDAFNKLAFGWEKAEDLLERQQTLGSMLESASNDVSKIIEKGWMAFWFELFPELPLKLYSIAVITQGSLETDLEKAFEERYHIPKFAKNSTNISIDSVISILTTYAKSHSSTKKGHRWIYSMTQADGFTLTFLKYPNAQVAEECIRKSGQNEFTTCQTVQGENDKEKVAITRQSTSFTSDLDFIMSTEQAKTTFKKSSNKTIGKYEIPSQNIVDNDSRKYVFVFSEKVLPVLLEFENIREMAALAAKEKITKATKLDSTALGNGCTASDVRNIVVFTNRSFYEVCGTLRAFYRNAQLKTSIKWDDLNDEFKGKLLRKALLSRIGSTSTYTIEKECTDINAKLKDICDTELINLIHNDHPVLFPADLPSNDLIKVTRYLATVSDKQITQPKFVKNLRRTKGMLYIITGQLGIGKTSFLSEVGNRLLKKEDNTIVKYIKATNIEFPSDAQPSNYSLRYIISLLWPTLKLPTLFETVLQSTELFVLLIDGINEIKDKTLLLDFIHQIFLNVTNINIIITSKSEVQIDSKKFENIKINTYSLTKFKPEEKTFFVEDIWKRAGIVCAPNSIVKRCISETDWFGELSDTPLICHIFATKYLKYVDNTDSTRLNVSQEKNIMEAIEFFIDGIVKHICKNIFQAEDTESNSVVPDQSSIISPIRSKFFKVQKDLITWLYTKQAFIKKVIDFKLDEKFAIVESLLLQSIVELNDIVADDSQPDILAEFLIVRFVKKYLDQEIDPSLEDTFSIQRIFCEVQFKNIIQILHILSNKISLHLFIENYKNVDQLIDACNTLNTNSSDNILFHKILHIGIHCNKMQLVQSTIGLTNVDVNYRGERGNTVYHSVLLTEKSNQLKMLEIIQKTKTCKKPNITIKNNVGKSVLELALDTDAQMEVVNFCIDNLESHQINEAWQSFSNHTYFEDHPKVKQRFLSKKEAHAKKRKNRQK